MSTELKPSYDPELGEALKHFPKTPTTTKETLPAERNGIAAMGSSEAVLTDPKILHKDITFDGPGGKIILAVLQAKNTAGADRPGIFFIHAGSMTMGTRLLGVGMHFEWIKQFDAVIVSVEYRLAPEHPDPAAIEDCYAGLKWMSENASELGINPDKILIVGQSAGGGLAAGTALLARDRGGPRLYGQVLLYPMLDDRMITTSSKQYMKEGTISGESIVASWDMYLSEKRGTKDISMYAAPSRALDLSRLPQTYIEVGAAELFRDENVAYATKLWEFGVQCEFHVWPGAFHAFDLFVPNAQITKTCLETRLAWVKRLLTAAPLV